jgi:hypothetical protein
MSYRLIIRPEAEWDLEDLPQIPLVDRQFATIAIEGSGYAYG